MNEWLVDGRPLSTLAKLALGSYRVVGVVSPDVIALKPGKGFPSNLAVAAALGTGQDPREVVDAV